MKKILCFLLAALMVLSMAACGGNSEQTGGNSTTPNTDPDVWTGGFSVGYAREDVTPPVGTIIYGLQNAGVTDRVSVGVLKPLCITCVAVTDETGATLLLYTVDIQYINRTGINALKKAVSEATGLAKEQMTFATTHTHSGVEMGGTWQKTLVDAAVKTAKDALADRAPATVSTGSTETKLMSFVRHYTTSSGKIVGDNFFSENVGYLTGHVSKAEDLLQVISFTRQGKKPVTMINWQGHNSMGATGSTSYGLQYRNYLSSDYVGFCRDYVEEKTDSLFAFYLAPSGNINPISSIQAERRTESAEEYGKLLGQYVELCLKDAKPMETGLVESNMTTYKGKADTGAARQMNIGVMGIGKIGFVIAPFEMFDTTGAQIRENSPYEMTFLLTLTDGSESYIPTQECWDYDVPAGKVCYEVGQCSFQRGTAELLVEEYGKLLNELYR